MASASTPFGTLTSKLKSALSAGVLFDGYQVIEPSGSPTTKAPSPVGNHPSFAPSGSRIGCGRPA